MFKTPVVAYDNEGKTYWQYDRIVSPNGFKLDLSISYDMKQTTLKKTLNDIRQKFQTHYIFDSKTNAKGQTYKHSGYRCAYKTAQKWLSVALNCPSLAKRTSYHSSIVSANRSKIKTFSYGMNNRYNLNIGDKFYIFHEMFLILVTGDGVKVSHVPKITQDTSIASLRFPIFNNDIFFSKNSMAVFLITTLGHQAKHVVSALNKNLKKLSNSNTFAIWSDGTFHSKS